jgi:hypothetical protein
MSPSPNDKPTPQKTPWRYFNEIFAFQSRRRSLAKDAPVQDKAAMRMVVATWVMACVSIVAAGVGYFQWIILRDTLAQMKAQERAWIAVTIQPRGGFLVNNDGASGLFYVTVTNQGHSPALNVEAHSRLLAIPPTGKGGPTYEAGVCQKSSADAVHGISVFPSEKADLRVEAVNVRRQLVDAATQNGHVTFLLELCVDYHSAGDPAAHRTENLYVLGHHWFPQKDAHGLIMAQKDRYDFQSSTDIDVPDLDHLGTEEKAY